MSRKSGCFLYNKIRTQLGTTRGKGRRGKGTQGPALANPLFWSALPTFPRPNTHSEDDEGNEKGGGRKKGRRKWSLCESRIAHKICSDRIVTGRTSTCTEIIPLQLRQNFLNGNKPSRAKPITTMPQQSSWSCWQRFLSERHFRQNAWTLLGLAAALIFADALQFLGCFLPASPPSCLAFYNRPAEAALRVLALPLAPALLAPGSLSLLAATRSPSLSGCACRACCLAIPVAACLLAAAVSKVADHAFARLRAEAVSDSAGAAAALANLAGLTLCVAGDCLLLVFLAMQACVARRWQRQRRRWRTQNRVLDNQCAEDVQDEEVDFRLAYSAEDPDGVDDLGARLARSPATAL